MPDPTGRVSHRAEMHRGVSWKQPCRVATTANITISTALNAGDSIDGVTLAAGDRVLVKDQSTGSQNGIYLAGVTPIRDFDMDQDATTSVPAEEALGAVVYIVAGTTNGGTTWRCTNTTAPVLGTDALTFTAFAGSSGTVTSVALTMPAGFTVTGSPITTSGTLVVTGGPLASDHQHIMDVLMNGDASTTAFELPAAPFDAYSVAAYVAGTLTEVTLSGTLLTTATFGSAPGSGTNNIRFDIVAAVA